MPLLTQVGIYRLEFQHENNDHPVSQVLDMRLSWNLSWRITLTREVELWRHQPFFSDVSRNNFWFVKYTRVMWHGWWRHQSKFFFKDDPWCKLQLHGIRRTWDTRAGVYNLSPPKSLIYNKTQNSRRVVETHSTVGVARTLHKRSRRFFVSSNDQCFGICTTKQYSKLI